MKEINNLSDLQPDGKYLILDEATDERWIVDIGDNYKPGQKPEEFEVFYKVLSTNTDRKIEDSEGYSAIECFIEDFGLKAFKLDGEEPDVKSEDINREIIKQKSGHRSSSS